MMSFATNTHQRPKQGMKPPRAAPIHPSAFIIHPLFAPLSPQTPSHPDPAPRLAPTRPAPLKSNFLAAESYARNR